MGSEIRMGSGSSWRCDVALRLGTCDARLGVVAALLGRTLWLIGNSVLELQSTKPDPNRSPRGKAGLWTHGLSGALGHRSGYFIDNQSDASWFQIVQPQ